MRMTFDSCDNSEHVRVLAHAVSPTGPARRWWRGAALPLSLIALLLQVWLTALPARAAQDSRRLRTENVFLIMSDGLRWQEVFSGAEEALMNSTNGGVKNAALLRTNFWGATPELRRKALLPFFWEEIARQGQIYGNRTKGSVALIRNPHKFSYPGYSEILTGFVDPQINSNEKKPNPNSTVFEWLGQQPRFRHRVAAFATWDVFPYIFNQERSGIPIWPPWEDKFAHKAVATPPLLLQLMQDTTPVFEGVALDSFVFHNALMHVRAQHPRLIFIGFGETDEWAHAGRYDLYLNAAHHFDRFLRTLWNTVQRIPTYRNKTTFLIGTDHGRGTGPVQWKDHGAAIQGADEIWLAALGPDTAALGERFHTGPIYQTQVAATLAALLGQDYTRAVPQAGKPIEEILRRR